MGKVNADPCPICGSHETFVSLQDARDYITGEMFQVMRCRSCEVRFTAPRPENLDPYYPKAYRRYNTFVLSVLRILYRFQVYRWRKLFKSPGSALEVGCGDGLMLDALRSKGWTVVGTERTDAMAEFTRNRLGLDVYSGGLEEVPAGQKFDLIILFQVLEHLDDPVKNLKLCADRLHSNGRLIIAVPNSNSWQSDFTAQDWLHLDVPRHLFHFSPVSLRNALNLVGLDMLSVSYTSFEHDPYGWIQSLLNKHLRDKNGLTRGLMKLDRFSISRMPAMFIAFVLVVPSVILSLISWAYKKGAIMQVVGLHAHETV